MVSGYYECEIARAAKRLTAVLAQLFSADPSTRFGEGEWRLLLKIPNSSFVTIEQIQAPPAERMFCQPPRRLLLSPRSINARSASEREAVLFRAAQLSTASIISVGNRNPTSGSLPPDRWIRVSSISFVGLLTMMGRT
jgi:hypothetical protein